MYAPTKALTEVPANLPVMLTVQDHVAPLLGISDKHARDLLAEGVIHGIKVGTAWRIPRDQFLAQFELA